MPPHVSPREPTPKLLFAVRYLLPAALLLAGVVCLFIPSSASVEAWAMFTGAGIAVFVLNVLHRAGVEGDRERAREEAARRYFTEHGQWPEEEPRPRGRTWTLAPGVETAERQEHEPHQRA
jgi:hypothetical protein